MTKKHPILIVDDDPHTLEALERVFKKDYKVLVAESGLEGLKALKKEAVSAIICDQRMPEMLGVEMLEKSIKIQPHAVRILITAYSDIEAVIGAINNGKIYHFETKPWDTHRLKNIVKKGILSTEQSIKIEEQNKTLTKLNKELKAANKKLLELDKAKDTFLNIVSHELKTPLTAILGFTDTFLSADSDTALKGTSLEYIQKASHRLLHVINDVILLTTLEAGKYKFHQEKVELSTLIHNILDSFKTEIKNKNIKVKTDLDKSSINADSTLLHTLFEKVIKNAIQYNKDQGTIHISATKTKKSLEIKLENTTDGTCKLDSKTIFNKFSGVSHMNHHSGGLGLGLPLSKSIIDIHQGTIEIATQKNCVTLKILFHSDTVL